MRLKVIKALLSAQTLDRCERSFAYGEDGAVVSVTILSGDRVHPELCLLLIKVIPQNVSNKWGLQHKIRQVLFALVRHRVEL